MAADTLVEFLLARVAEDEAVARKSSPGPWVWDDDNLASATVEDEAVVITDGGAYPPYGATAEHIARHDPARVLAECEAKRRLVEMHRGLLVAMEQLQGDETAEVVTRSGAAVSEGAIRVLASVYADHPDYQERWRP